MANTAVEAWKQLSDKPKIVSFFDGMFHKMGIVVTDSEEELTVHLTDGRFKLEEGIDPDSDYVIELSTENIANMIRHGEDGEIDEDEAFRIMTVLFRPLSRATMQNAKFQAKEYKLIADVENHLAIYLEHPRTKEHIGYTFIYLNDNWMIIPGIYGQALRTFTLTPQEIIRFQKKVFAALKSSDITAWKNFDQWYSEWKNEVSTTFEE